MKRLTIMLLLVLGLAACGTTATNAPAAQPSAAPATTTEAMADKTGEAMMEEKATGEAMADKTGEAMMEEKATGEAMADKTGEAMMEEKVTGEAMADKTGEAMADKTGEAMADKTGEAMADKTGEAMADKTGEAMADKTGEAMADKTGEAMADKTGEAMADKTGEAMAEKPAWQTIALTDARTGETFTLADFAGKTVYVEPMATWCPNCKQQLGNVNEAKQQLNSDNYAFVALSVETDLDPAQLAKYAEETGYDLRFAVVSPEMLQALTDAFGRTAANPPSTPHFIIQPDGTAGELETGFATADEIVKKLGGG
jgi:peroxiredoxin